MFITNSLNMPPTHPYTLVTFFWSHLCQLGNKQIYVEQQKFLLSLEWIKVLNYIRHVMDAKQYQRLAEKKRSLFEKLYTEGTDTPQHRKI